MMDIKYYNMRLAIIGLLLCFHYGGWTPNNHWSIGPMFAGIFALAWLGDAFIHHAKEAEKK